MATRRRLERLSKTLMKEIAAVIMTDVKDPRLLSMVSVMDVEMSEDMRHAKVITTKPLRLSSPQLAIFPPW